MKRSAKSFCSVAVAAPAVTTSEELASAGKASRLRNTSDCDARVNDRGTKPTSALPLATNWSAWATFSP